LLWVYLQNKLHLTPSLDTASHSSLMTEIFVEMLLIWFSVKWSPPTPTKEYIVFVVAAPETEIWFFKFVHLLTLLISSELKTLGNWLLNLVWSFLWDFFM
jgi:hypothetical protein